MSKDMISPILCRELNGKQPWKETKLGNGLRHENRKRKLHGDVH